MACQHKYKHWNRRAGRNWQSRTGTLNRQVEVGDGRESGSCAANFGVALQVFGQPLSLDCIADGLAHPISLFLLLLLLSRSLSLSVSSAFFLSGSVLYGKWNCCRCSVKPTSRLANYWPPVIGRKLKEREREIQSLLKPFSFCIAILSTLRGAILNLVIGMTSKTIKMEEAPIFFFFFFNFSFCFATS